MILNLVRSIFNENSTIGKLYVEGNYECYTLEDTVREGEKIFGKTAIPKGNYIVILDYSQHFQKVLPHILDVPNFEGVRIHSGNRPKDTEGCILVGLSNPRIDWINKSQVAFNLLYRKLENAYDNNEDIIIKIE